MNTLKKKSDIPTRNKSVDIIKKSIIQNESLLN